MKNTVNFLLNSKKRHEIGERLRNQSLGSFHWLIQDLPTKDWIHWFEDGKNGFKRSNYRTNSQMNPYAADVDKK